MAQGQHSGIERQSTPKLPPAQHTLLTAEDLWKRADDGYRYELVKEELRRMPPAGFEHRIRAAKIGRHLDAHVEKYKLGYVCGAETGFKISQNPDTVRAPDAALVRQAALAQQGVPKGYWEGAPDLAVDIISPNDTYAEVTEKIGAWFTAGCAMVWVLNPRQETVEVHRPIEAASQPTSTYCKTVLTGNDTLDGADVVEEFQCQIQDIFV